MNLTAVVRFLSGAVGVCQETGQGPFVSPFRGNANLVVLLFLLLLV